MKIVNVHQRKLAADAALVGQLLDHVADAVWPVDRWPRLKLDKGLQPGSCGGHGPIRYVVEEHVPGRSVTFRITAPRGFVGTHAFKVVPEGGRTVLRYVLDMRVEGLARITWPLVFRPLHDALIEDALDRAEAAVGRARAPRPLSRWVRVLRSWLARPRAQAQLPA